MKPLSTTFAAVLTLLSPRLYAQGSRVAEPVGGGPTVTGQQNGTPNVDPNIAGGINTTNLQTNLNVDTKLGASGVTATGVNATGQSRVGMKPTWTGPTGQGQKPTRYDPNGPDRPVDKRPVFSGGGGAMRPVEKREDAEGQLPAEKPQTRTRPTNPAVAPSESKLDTTVTEIKKTEKTDADGLGVSSSLKRVFDAAGSGRALPPGGSAPSVVAGKTQRAVERIMQMGAVAEQANSAEQAKLIMTAVGAAKEAEAQKALSTEAARRAQEAFMSYGRARVEKALPELADAAYKAAALGSSGAREVKRALSGLDAWEKLLGQPGKPLVKNAAQLKADVARFQEAAARPGAKLEAPKIRFEKKGDSYFAQLPRGSVAQLSASLAADMQLTTDPTAALSGTWLDRALIDHARNPGAGALFSTARANAQGVEVPAAFSAGALTLRSLLASVWHYLIELVSRFFGSDRLAALRRAPSADEREAAAAAPGAQALDLARFNAPYLQSQRLRGESAQTPAAANSAVAAARALASAHDALVGGSSGAAMTEKLAARVLGQARASSDDLRLLHAWVDEMYAASMGAVLKPLASSAKGPAVFFDLTPGSGMVGVIGGALNSERLARAGFEVRGENVAVFGPGGSREDLAAALEAASGKTVEAPAKAPAPELSGALTFVKARPSDSEALAAQIQADMALSKTLAFEPVGRVAADGGAMTVSRGWRKKGKQLEQVYLLTQPATGRVFGYKAAAP